MTANVFLMFVSIQCYYVVGDISHVLIVCCWCDQLKEEAKNSEESYYSTAQDVKSD